MCAYTNDAPEHDRDVARAEAPAVVDRVAFQAELDARRNDSIYRTNGRPTERARLEAGRADDLG